MHCINYITHLLSLYNTVQCLLVQPARNAQTAIDGHKHRPVVVPGHCPDADASVNRNVAVEGV